MMNYTFVLALMPVCEHACGVGWNKCDVNIKNSSDFASLV